MPIRYMTKDEIDHALPKLEGIYYLAAMLQWRAGLRISEALAIRPRDIDYDKEVLTVQSGKGDKQRTVQLHPELISALRGAIRPKGGKPYIQVVRQTVGRQYAKAGIRGTHVLRHSYARHMLANGVLVNQLQLLMGHAHLQTTLRYLALTSATVNMRKIE